MRQDSSRISRLLAVGLAVSLFFAVSACSSSVEDPTMPVEALNTTTSPPSTSTSTTTTQAPTTTALPPETTTTTSFPIDETADPFPPEDLVGEWFTDAGYLHVFNDDGWWTIASPDEPDRPLDSGSWEVKTATFVIVSELEENKTRCQPGATGYYEISHGDGGEIDLKPLDDDCTARWGGLRLGLTPAS